MTCQILLIRVYDALTVVLVLSAATVDDGIPIGAYEIDTNRIFSAALSGRVRIGLTQA